MLLVVIGVGPTDHLNTRHCNHDSATSLSLSRAYLPPVTPSLPIAQSSRFLTPTSRVSLSGEYLQIATAVRHPSSFVSILDSSRRFIATISRGYSASWLAVRVVYDDRQFSSLLVVLLEPIYGPPVPYDCMGW